MTELLQHPAAEVFFYALITAIATGLGALPFFAFKDLTQNWLGISNATAAGLILAASFGLIYEGLNYDLWFTVGGVMIGLVLSSSANRYSINMMIDFRLSISTRWTAQRCC